MSNRPVVVPLESYRRPGTANRALTLAPLVPSQDVTRYKARNMPVPRYHLDREVRRTPWFAIGVIALAIVAACMVLFL